MKKRDLFIKIFHSTYFKLINNDIDENKFLEMFNKLITKGFKTYHIDNMDDILLTIKNRGFKLVYNIVKFNITRDYVYKDINNFKDLSFVKKIFGINRVKVKTKILTLIKKINTLLNVIKSFLKFEFNIFMDLEKSIEIVYKYDMIERLILLLNHFSLDDMKMMDVKIKKISDVDKMSFDDLFIYYTEVIDNIESILLQLLKSCESYETVENDYHLYCHKHNPL